MKKREAPGVQGTNAGPLQPLGVRRFGVKQLDALHQRRHLGADGGQSLAVGDLLHRRIGADRAVDRDAQRVQVGDICTAGDTARIEQRRDPLERGFRREETIGASPILRRERFRRDHDATSWSTQAEMRAGDLQFGQHGLRVGKRRIPNRAARERPPAGAHGSTDRVAGPRPESDHHLRAVRPCRDTGLPARRERVAAGGRTPLRVASA